VGWNAPTGAHASKRIFQNMVFGDDYVALVMTTNHKTSDTIFLFVISDERVFWPGITYGSQYSRLDPINLHRTLGSTTLSFSEASY
jgi:hypothetical protein